MDACSLDEDDSPQGKGPCEEEMKHVDGEERAAKGVAFCPHQPREDKADRASTRHIRVEGVSAWAWPERSSNNAHNTGYRDEGSVEGNAGAKEKVKRDEHGHEGRDCTAVDILEDGCGCEGEGDGESQERDADV